MRITVFAGVAALAGILSLNCAAYAAVVINEIHYAPADKTIPEEFVELYNSGATSVDLSGWYFSDGIHFVFPPGTVIEADEYLVVAEDPGTIRSIYGNIAVVGSFTRRLSNERDNLVLRNSGGGREDEVDYRRGFPWPTVGGEPGYSIELVHPGFENDLGGSWRASDPGLDDSATIVRDGETWKYFKGTTEPSNPRSAWRAVGFNDAGWLSGRASIGYGEGFVSTNLTDMRSNYSTVYLRKEFDVADSSAIGSLVLDVQYDDGFNAWINGVHVASENVSSSELAFDATARSAIENLDFVTSTLPNPASYIVTGTNVIAVQLLNASVGGSSDAFIDLRLRSSSNAGSGPTPGARNSVFSSSLAPQMRQARHFPPEPNAGEPVFLFVKATDADGVASVTLEYQVVEPGSYIDLDDPEYLTAWTALEMKDDGNGVDSSANDSVFSAMIPAAIQVHRRLIRYRFTATDKTGLSLTAPYADDPQPNFAYFVYDEAPSWSGAIEPGSSNAARRQVVTYGEEVMNQLPIYHLITTRTATEDCTWFSKYGGSEYLWRGTLVAHGKVYDHVRFRARGGVWRYAMGKNMWKFDFLRGHNFQAFDDFGRAYDTTWHKLNFSAIIQQGNFRHRGEQGLFEAAGFRLFNLMGVESPKTHFVQFRIIDEPSEFGRTQYDGDLWGLYLVIEQMDGRFLDEHQLPDGNLYKMEGGTGELNNQGPTAVTDKSDLNSFQNTYTSTNPSNSWWRQNLDLSGYYSYRCVVEGIHHYDIGNGKNYFYYLNPESLQWSVLPWDLDLTWADNMYGDGNEPFKSRVLSRSVFNLEYRNRLREFRDLLYNNDQANQLIDEFGAMVDDPGGEPSIVDVDRSLWDYNPIMIDSSIVNTTKAGHGRFYERSATRDFPGMRRIMKNYVVSRGNWIDSVLLDDDDIPNRPVVTSAMPPGAPLDALFFRVSEFSDPQGSHTFQQLRWRAGEVAKPGAPAYSPAAPRPYEINTVWERSELSPSGEVQVPPTVLKVGHQYRVRARYKDNTGRWSHWSPPVEFSPGLPAVPFPQLEALRITEMMYHPRDGSDLEFLELLNISAETLDLRSVSFTDGIEFSFAGADVTELPPGEYVVLVNNRVVFESAYDTAGMLIAGEYGGRLSNAGERITLTYGANLHILDYGFSDEWYPLTDGGGRSLVIVDPYARPETWNEPLAWNQSADVGGSPGRPEGGGPVDGLQRVGDSNQDGRVDISDVRSLLVRMFGSGGAPLLCKGTGLEDGGSLLILDSNGDGAVDISDALYLLAYLFENGPPPASGDGCVRAEGCDSICVF